MICVSLAGSFGDNKRINNLFLVPASAIYNDYAAAGDGDDDGYSNNS